MNIGMFPKGVDLTEATIAMARLAGCTCNVEVDLDWHREGHVRHIAVRHDDWCPVLVRAERRN
jgi:hypothetical protein